MYIKERLQGGGPKISIFMLSNLWKHLIFQPVTGRLSSGTAWSGGGDGGREEIKVGGPKQLKQ